MLTRLLCSVWVLTKVQNCFSVGHRVKKAMKLYQMLIEYYGVGVSFINIVSLCLSPLTGIASTPRISPLSSAFTNVHGARYASKLTTNPYVHVCVHGSRYATKLTELTEAINLHDTGLKGAQGAHDELRARVAALEADLAAAAARLDERSAERDAAVQVCVNASRIVLYVYECVC